MNFFERKWLNKQEIVIPGDVEVCKVNDIFLRSHILPKYYFDFTKNIFLNCFGSGTWRGEIPIWVSNAIMS